MVIENRENCSFYLQDERRDARVTRDQHTYGRTLGDIYLPAVFLSVLVSTSLSHDGRFALLLANGVAATIVSYVELLPLLDKRLAAS